MTVSRYDRAPIRSGGERTSQGFLRAPATLTRAGVLVYRRGDGTEQRELRPEDEVFAPESLASARSIPVTHLHPLAGEVDAKSARAETVGWTGDTIERQDALVSGSVVIIDADLSAQVEAKTLGEISMGYRCEMEHVAGVDPVHGPYDAIQRKIRYNHAALLAPGDGRAGPEARVRLDAADAVELDANPKSAVQQSHVVVKRKTTREDRMLIKIAGVDFDLDNAAAQAVQAEMTRLDAASKALEAERDKLAGKAEALEADLAKANDPVRVDSAVAEKLALIEKARKVLGASAEVKGSPREIMEQCLRHDRKDIVLDGKSDAHVEGRFEALLERSTETRVDGVSPVGAALAAHAEPTVRKGDAARAAMLERNRNAWKSDAK